MLVDIHFQKYNRYKFLESYWYRNNGGLEPRQKTSAVEIETFQTETTCKGTQWKVFLTE